MGHTNSIHGYSDVMAILDKAKATDKGVVIRAPLNKLKGLRARMYAFRNRVRKLNEQMYEPGDPRQLFTDYDHMQTVIDESKDPPEMKINTGFGALAELEIIDVETGEQAFPGLGQ